LDVSYRYTKALDSIKALRKERVAELKSEKERLESLAREKGHADKLKARISDLSASIARKEVEYQDTKKSYEALARSNRKFEEGATKFREIYIRVENLEKEKMKYQEELAELRPNVQETQGKLSMLRDVLVDTNFFRHRRATGGTYQELQLPYRRATECPTARGSQ
jgi:DNA repair protein RAD50